MAGIDNYAQALRSVTRGFWSGVLSESQFRSAIRSAMNRRLEQAFEEGAAECGILPDEFTPEEQIVLGRAVNEELGRIGQLATRIDQNSKVNGGKLQPLLDRVSTLWVARYDDLKNRGKAFACKDRKAEWQINPAKENCSSCLKLNGKVKRMSFWTNSGILPRIAGAAYLVCHGFLCGCSLVFTDKPISRGPLPRLP